MRKSIFVLAALCLSVLTFGQKIEFAEYDLKNGLHVILHEDHNTPIVAVSVMYHVGSKNEDPELTGFAHFFEHLLFEGSKNIGRGEFSKYVENAGGMLNANTTQDRTYYYEVLPSNQLELGLWLESERMLHALVDQKGIDTQREVIKEEKRSRYDDQPYGSILFEVMARAFKEHPYRWPTIGSMEHIDAATLEDFKAFYNKYYVPNNAVLVIAGDIDLKTTKKLVEMYFGGIPKGKEEIKQIKVLEPEQQAEIRDVIEDNIQLPAVVQAYRTPARGTRAYFAMQMLSKLLSDGQSSRLNKALVEEHQKALAVGTFPLPLEDPSVTIAYAICNVGATPEEVEVLMDAEYEKVKTKPIEQKELQKLRIQMETDLIAANQKMAGIATNLATHYTLDGRAGYINEMLTEYASITAMEIMKVAQKYLTKENRVVLYYVPKSQN